MTAHQSDLILFLRLAGTKSGVRSRHIPSKVLASVAALGGRVQFRGNRVRVCNSAAMLRRIEGFGAQYSGMAPQ